MTIYERIKSMIVEKMADYEHIACPYRIYDLIPQCGAVNDYCHKCMIDWLESEVFTIDRHIESK